MNASDNKSKLIQIQRPVFNWKTFHRDYRAKSTKDLPFYEQMVIKISRQWKKCSLLQLIRSLLPVVEWLPKYDLRTDLLADSIAGLTVSVLHIPHGISNAFLAGLEPIVGLYVSFFPALVYFLMGTSHHISMGSFAVSSMMMRSVADRLQAIGPEELNGTDVGRDHWPPSRLQVATSVAMLSGLIQIAMGFLSLGRLSLFLSDELISSFTTGIVFHVVVSQLDNILGIDVESQRSGPLKLIRSLNAIYKEIDKTNVRTVVLSLILMTVLVIFKDVIHPRLKIKFALPIDFSVIILGTLMSWLMNFKDNLEIDVVGVIPTGFPEPSVPRFDLFSEIIIDCLMMAIVSFAISLSVAKILSKKNGYDVRANQELIAIGSANVFSSFFKSIPASAALSRSTLQERVGGRTQMAAIFSCLVILSVVLFLAPYLYHLPEFVLSSILIVAIRGMFLQFKDFWEFWFISKIDGISWMFTFLSVIFMDIDSGLIIGILFSIHIILYRLISPSSSTLGRLPSTEIYVSVQKYSNAEEINRMKIFRFCSPIFYLTNDMFKQDIYELTQTDKNDSEKSNRKLRPKVLILDMSCVGFMDRSGVETIAEVTKQLRELGTTVCLVCCPVNVIDILIRTKFFDNFEKTYVLPTIHDAVIQFQ